MDVDDQLRDAELPPVTVDTDGALLATTRRGRTRRRRRTLVVGSAVALLVAGIGATAVAVTGSERDGDEAALETDSARGAATSGETPADGPRATPESGAHAVWRLASDDVDPAATQVDVLVSRIECSGGVTGEVLEPGVVTTETEVVVTFTVAPLPPGGYTCPGNDEVPATVDLGEPIGTRALVDGSCTAPEGPEGPLGDCALDGIRWHLPGTTPATDEPHACDAAHDPDGRTDVATEPDGRSADDADWTDRDGCIVRIDVVAERPGPANCGWEATRVLTTARVPGVRPDDGDETVDFVRDPDGAYGDPELVSGLDLDADVPDDAVDTGLRLGEVELWAVLDDPSAVWLASPDGVERWPAGEVPLCR